MACYSSVGQNYRVLNEEDYGKYSSDGFFESSVVEYRAESDWDIMPMLPNSHGYSLDHSAVSTPVGNGLLLLSLLGAGYVARKKMKR